MEVKGTTKAKEGSAGIVVRVCKWCGKQYPSKRQLRSHKMKRHRELVVEAVQKKVQKVMDGLSKQTDKQRKRSSGGSSGINSDSPGQSSSGSSLTVQNSTNSKEILLQKAKGIEEALKRKVTAASPVSETVDINSSKTQTKKVKLTTSCRRSNRCSHCPFIGKNAFGLQRHTRCKHPNVDNPINSEINATEEAQAQNETDDDISEEPEEEAETQTGQLDPKELEMAVANGLVKKCPVCNQPLPFKTSLDKARFKEHIEIHEGLRPFVCPYFRDCGRSFADPVDLLSHTALSHEHGDAFECDRCGQTFQLRRFFTRHQRSSQSCKKRLDSQKADEDHSPSSSQSSVWSVRTVNAQQSEGSKEKDPPVAGPSGNVQEAEEVSEVSSFDPSSPSESESSDSDLESDENNQE